MRVTVTDDIRLHVLVDGDDTGELPILLVHGLASNARLWDGVRDALAAKGRTVAAVDLRGHGLSDKPDDGYDFETIAADVLGVLDALGWQSAVLAGQSWGGNVVLEAAARYRDRVAGVVCVDGGWIELGRMGPWENVRERMAPPKLEGTKVTDIEHHMRRVHHDWSDTAINGALACFEVREDGTVKPWLTRERHLKILRHLWEHKPREVFPRVGAPTILVPVYRGEQPGQDKRSAVEVAGQELAISKTVWFEASHDVHAERPDDIANLIAGLPGL